MSKKGKRRGKRKASGPVTKSCNGCSRELPQHGYSKKQWGRENGSCIPCTDERTKKHNADAKARAIAAKTERQRIESAPLAIDRSLASSRGPSKTLANTIGSKLKVAGSASASNTRSEPAITTTTGATGDGDCSGDGGNGPLPVVQPNPASTLLRALTDEEADIAHNAMYGPGHPNEILATCDAETVQRQSLHLLQPGVWINDEIVHCYLQILAKRDSELAARSPGRKRCHFFKSYFITKLLDEAGGYNFDNVERWSQKVPGKDIFALDKIFFPGECYLVWSVVHLDMLMGLHGYFDFTCLSGISPTKANHHLHRKLSLSQRVWHALGCRRHLHDRATHSVL